LQGPCAVDTTLFWKPTCVYASGGRNPTCGNAFLDPQFTTPTPYGTDATACYWHYGLVSSVCGPYPIPPPIPGSDTATFGSSHVGNHIFVGELTTFIHATDGRFPENPNIQFWVK
jgi:hypothetical protein